MQRIAAALAAAAAAAPATADAPADAAPPFLTAQRAAIFWSR